LLFVGFRAALLIGLGLLFILLENVAQVGLTGLNVFSYGDDAVERNR
jgi:hypothetical protein